MNVRVSIDRPASSLIYNAGQEFTGWLAYEASADQKPEFTIDGVPVNVTCYRREDVERILSRKRVVGWTFHLDPLRTFGQKQRTLELKVRLGDQWIHTRHFFKSKNLMAADCASSLFFMHIPKTAGTALRQFVDFAFSAYPSLFVYGDPPGLSLTQVLGPFREFAMTRELIFGHYDFGFARELYGSNPKVVTILRDPQELVRSYLDFVPEPAPQFVDNPLTRHICGLSYVEPFGLISAAHLEMALRTIDRHFYILQQDRLQEFADHFSQLFGLPHFAVPRINTADRNTRIEGVKLPVDLRYDMQLYEACRNRSVNFLEFLNA
jgi:hypothetical protein